MKIHLRCLFAPVLLVAPASAQWLDIGNSMTTIDRVSIGTSFADSMLTIHDFGYQAGLYGPSTAAVEVHQMSHAPAIWATAGSTDPAIIAEGSYTGVQGVTQHGTGVRGEAHGENSLNVGVEGSTNSSHGYSGKFHGGRFFVDVERWVGINRDLALDPADVLAIDARTDEDGGMTINTTGERGRPYYGYATADRCHARHYYSANSHQWRLDLDGVRLAVNGSNGRVGIGTLTPQYQLHVHGSAGKPGGGSWSNASDMRLKKNVAVLDDSLERLLAIRGVTFEYTDPDAIGELHGVRTGVLAQEVEAVFPDWVDEGADGFKRVTFRGFEGVAIEALRELREDNESLRRGLAEQSRATVALERRLARLEAGK